MPERTGNSPRRAVAATLATFAVLAATPPPASAQAEVWNSTLTVGEHTVVAGDDVDFRGYRSDTSTGSLSDDDFDLSGTSFTVSMLSIVVPATSNVLRLVLDADPGAHASFLTLHLGSASLPLADADLDTTRPTYFEWSGHGLSWAASDTVQARLTFQAPDPVSCTGIDNCFEVPASWELVPSGLTAGSSFRLLLLTSVTRDATSSDIADYNTFVQGSAAAGHLFIQPYKSHFKALGSTEDADAGDNTATTYTSPDKGVPIYWLGGDKVADDYEDFYDDSWDSGNVRNESGSLVSVPDGDNLWVWTGSEDDGTEFISSSTESYALGNSETHGQARRGAAHTLIGGSISDPLNGGAGARSSSHPLYALSPILKVAEDTPEPDPGPCLVEDGCFEVLTSLGLAPPGITEGTSFRLLFLTSTTRDATSSDIADYNTHVQDAAAAGHAAIQAYSSEFKALGSTEDTDARDNTETAYTDDAKGVPIYWLGGDKVADDYEDFYDVEWASGAVRDESGSLVSVPDGDALWVATGSEDDGREYIGTTNTESYALGNSETHNQVRVAGAHQLINEGRGNDPLNFAALTRTDSYPYYALSPVFRAVSQYSDTVPSNWTLIPSGLPAGDKFRLLFLTDDEHSPTSTDIADYNTYVQGQAAAGHAAIQAYSSQFRALGSTADIDARDNTGTTYTDGDKGVPIYWLGGSKVADEYEDFYDGSWDDEANPRGSDGNAISPARVWTGSETDGTEGFNTSSESRAFGTAGNVRTGRLNHSSSDPLDSAEAFAPTTTSYRYYALSRVLTVGSLNSAPVFSDTAPVARSVAENTPAGENVGAAVAASDTNTGDTLVYSLGGTDAASFVIVAASGQIQTKSGVSYDHETKSGYSVEVTATDGTATVSIAVEITVTDVDEQPETPAAPAVWAPAGTTDSLGVSWTAPGRNGGPALTGYKLRYRTGASGTWTEPADTLTGTSATIGSLDLNSAYDVQVQALNGETPSAWSPSGTGTTGTAANAGAEVWSSTLTVGEHTVVAGDDVDFRGYRSDTSTGSLSDDDFDLSGTSFTVSALSIVVPDTSNVLRLVLDADLGAHSSYLTLHLDSASFPLADADFDPDRPGFFEWSDHGLSWADSDTVQARLTFQAPDPVPCTGVDNCFEVPASWELVPSGLTAGSSFRLLLLTSTTRDATSSDIADYNTFVQASAAAGHLFIQPYESHFNALGSTENTDARDNTATTYTDDDKGVPIYWLDGDKVADDYEDFYDASWDSGNVRNESGSLVSVPDGDSLFVWTGSNDDGTEYIGGDTTTYALGNSETHSQVRRGSAHTLINGANTSEPLDGGGAVLSSASHPLYALSPILKVVADTDETTDSGPSLVADGPYEVLTSWGLAPSGITDGTSFRLLFLTSTTRNATSSEIADYNSHVQTAAAGHAAIQAYSSQFKALGSTEDTNARDNTGTTYTDDDKGVPVYWLNGAKVADEYEDFYDGSWDSGNVRDESGSLVTASGGTLWVWTGSKDDGTEYIGRTNKKSYALGNSETHANARRGAAHVLIGGYRSTPLTGGGASGSSSANPFYALSPVFKAVTQYSDTEVPSNWALIPTGLTTGDRFRLLFLTANDHSPTSTDIADYNTWVQGQAAAGHAAIQAYSDGFGVLGSTAGTDARDNTSTTYTDGDKGVPIYWLGGSKVADEYEDFYDGDWDDEANPRGSDGSTISPARVWTGSETDGTEGFNSSSESRAFGTTGNVRTGWLNHSSSDPLDSAESFAPATSYRYYALSRVFTVGAQVVAVNSAPVFSDTAPAARSVAENSAAGTSVGAAVAAADTDIGDMLVYSLGGTDAASFAIVSSSGQIQTKSGVTYDHETQSSYAVQVSVTDGTATVSIAVAITLTDVAERPETPAAPSVAATANTTDSLDVSWTAPGRNGGPALTGYDLQYRKGASGSWSSWTHSGTGTSATIAPLDANSSYDVRVRALNGETPSAWSPSGTGSTANSLPVFSDTAAAARSVAENAVAETNVGAAVAATDDDTTDTLIYSLGGTDAASFAIVSTSGQIQTKSGVTYDHETKSSYSVDVSVTDGTATVSIAVAITLTDVAEQPETPAVPSVAATANTTDSLDVGWTAPGRNGGPALTGYDLQYRKGASGNWSSWTHNGTGTSATIAPLDANSSYDVRVRALNGETPSDWSPSGTGSTGNSLPVFSDTAPAARSVAENSAAGTSVGAAVAATDTDTGDTLVYSLRSTGDDTSFAIVSTSGQIQTKSGVTFDHETKPSYAVQVSVTDGTATVSIAVTITVTDVNEQPARPAAPSVAATPGTTDSLDVSWTAPGRNGGPALTGYELQYRKGATASWTSRTHSGTGTSATIAPLDANSSYQVQVRALNGENPSDWSPSGTGTTGVPGLSIADSSAAEGTGTMAFAVTLSEAASEQVTVAYATSGGTATQGTDYTAASGTLTFAPGDTARTIPVTVADDSIAEGEETFQVTLSAPQNASLSDATATGTITDNDQASTAIALSVNPGSVMENAGGTTITVTATLDAAARTTATEVTVRQTGGTAMSGTDYAAVSDFTLTIAANQTSGTATFTFTPLDDSHEDGDEMVVLTGSAEGLADGSVTLTITNDDSMLTAIELSLSPDSVAEDAGSASVTVTAAFNGGTRAAATPVRVTLQGDSAAAGEDFRAVSPFTLTIPAEQPSVTGTFTLRPVNDSIAEGTETLEVVGTSADLAEGRAALAITDDDEESSAVILSVSPSSVSESTSARSVRVTATLDAGARTVPTNVVVTLYSEEAAFGPGQDAAVVEPFTITIPALQASASRSFTFRPRDDDEAEGTESIEVRGEATGLRVEPATLELTDNDTDTVNLAVPYLSRHSEGGGAAYVVVEATLDAERSADTTVTVRVRGSRRSGVVGFAAVDDFELTIPAGKRRGEAGFDLQPQDDEEAERDETLTISGRASGLRVTSATFLLEDDDSETASSKVTLALDETRLAESEGTHFDLTVTGTLDGAALEQDTVVTLEATNRASDGSEVTALVDSGIELTIRAGRISGQRTFGIVLNTLGIDQENGELTLGGTVDGLTADGLTVEAATLELLDGDAAPDLITLTLSETRVPEGWSGRVNVLAEMTPSARGQETVVELTVTGSGRADAVGFEAVADFKLTIPEEWEAYGTGFDLFTEDDDQAGRDETLTVSGTTDVAGLTVRSATMVLVERDGARNGPAKTTLWTDRAGYEAGQPLRLYREVDPGSEGGEHEQVYYRERIGSGERVYLVPRESPGLLREAGPGAADAGAARPVAAAERKLAWEGAAPEPGLWQFVAELREPGSGKLLRRAYAKFVVSGKPPVVQGADGAPTRIAGETTWTATRSTSCGTR